MSLSTHYVHCPLPSALPFYNFLSLTATGASAPIDIHTGSLVTGEGHLSTTLSNKSREVPVNSYSSSDDDDFFDATEDQASGSLK